MAIEKKTIDWRQGFAELSFIPVASDWIELLASRLAQPLMFISSLYIIAETTIPGVAAWSAWLDLSTRTVMSLAPEIILPGCFLQAQQSQRDNKGRKARLLFILFGFCIFLLGITLASFIWHFSDAINGFILFVRCGVGVTYTVILKIDKESGAVIAQPVQPSAIEELRSEIEETLRKDLDALAQSVQRLAQTMQAAQSPVSVEEIAQLPEPIDISIAQPTKRPEIAQRSALRNDDEEDSTESDRENTEELPVAQRQTEKIRIVRGAQSDDEDMPPVMLEVAQSDELPTTDAGRKVWQWLDDYFREHGSDAATTNQMIQNETGVAKNTVSTWRNKYFIARGRYGYRAERQESEVAQ